MPVSVPPSERASHRPIAASSLGKKKWTPAWSRCSAHKCVSAGRPPAADLEHISNYLSNYFKERHPHYRQPTMRKLYEAIRSRKESPQPGRLGHEDGTRELLFPPTPYIAVYRVKGQSIEVLRIYHAAQDRP